MKIGQIPIAHPLTLASLEEHSNYPFRLLMKQFGASLVVSERVDAADVARPTAGRCGCSIPRRPNSPRRPDQRRRRRTLAAAAERVAQQGFDMVDLNFECPVRRLLARGEGGALLADPPAIARLVAAVVGRVSIPVTLKIRSGPDAEHPTAVEVARQAEQAGAAAVSVHARSVAQGYAAARIGS